MLQDQDSLAQPSSLKRPRPEPPSPSTSSPKRAASEDTASVAAIAVDSSLASAHAQATHFPSSPLGMNVDADDELEAGWVARTGQVSLSEDAAASNSAAATGQQHPAVTATDDSTLAGSTVADDESMDVESLRESSTELMNVVLGELCPAV